MLSALLDHLWQSTLVAFLAGLIVLALRKAPASARHGVWFAASLKFLIPFAALAALGRLLAPSLRLPVAAPEKTLIETAAEPFTQASLSRFPFAHQAALQAPLPPFPATQLPPAPPVHAALHLDLTAILFAVWALGFGAVLVRWAVRLGRVLKVLRAARPLDWPAPMPVLVSPTLLEPGLIGFLRPVLVAPESLPRYLSRSQIDAIIAHEACHLRRRDNLTAALHMLVEAVFWFHPLVWWIGTRLIAERERACDEAVIAAGHDRAAYARSLVESCRLYLQSPLDCVAGAAGSNLKARVEAIMTAPPTSPLSRATKALLLAAGACAFATPVAAGLLTTPEGQKAVAHVAAIASRAVPTQIAPVVGPTTETPAAPDEQETAKPVVVARNEPIVGPGPAIASLAAAPRPLARDLAAPRIDQAPAGPAAAAADAQAQAQAQAASFVDFFAATPKRVLARWRDPICVKISGLRADQAAAVEARVVEVAKAVGVRTRPEGCKDTNLQIAFTAAPQGMIDDVASRMPDALGDWNGTREQKTVTRPIQAWYATNGGTIAENNAGGAKVKVLYQADADYPFFPPAGRNDKAFKPFTSEDRAFPVIGHRAFVTALVIVDTRRTTGMSLGLVSDYVALLALSQPLDLGRCNALPSITDLFASCPGRAAPDGLTPADAAFLTALYAAKTGKTGDEQADIATRMASILAADAGARADAAAAQPIRPASTAAASFAPARLPQTSLAPVTNAAAGFTRNPKTDPPNFR